MKTAQIDFKIHSEDDEVLMKTIQLFAVSQLSLNRFFGMRQRHATIQKLTVKAQLTFQFNGFHQTTRWPHKPQSSTSKTLILRYYLSWHLLFSLKPKKIQALLIAFMSNHLKSSRALIVRRTVPKTLMKRKMLKGFVNSWTGKSLQVYCHYKETEKQCDAHSAANRDGDNTEVCD